MDRKPTTIYRKVGRRYVPVADEYARDSIMLSPGVWLVPGPGRLMWMMSLDDERCVIPLAQLMQHVDAVSTAVLKKREAGASAYDLAKVAIEALAKAMEAKNDG